MNQEIQKSLIALASVSVLLLSANAWAEAAEAIGAAVGIVAQAANISAANSAAGADVAVAGINASATVRQAEINAEVQREGNAINGNVALFNTAAQANTAAMLEQGKTERQAMLSTESILASKDKNATEREKNWMDYEYNVAKLLQEDRGREQQLALDRQTRDLQASINLLRAPGSSGGLEITKFSNGTENRSVADTTNAKSALATSQTTQSPSITAARERLTNAIKTAPDSLSKRLVAFRGSKNASSARGMPQLLVASANLERTTPMVRGSFSSKLLAVSDTVQSTSNALRGVRPSYPGAAHGDIGRNNSSSESSDGGSDDRHH